MLVLFTLGALGFAETFLELNFTFGWTGWLFWAFILFFFIKVKHPPVQSYQKLDTTRMILGYISIFILIISFSPTPFIVSL